MPNIFPSCRHDSETKIYNISQLQHLNNPLNTTQNTHQQTLAQVAPHDCQKLEQEESSSPYQTIGNFPSTSRDAPIQR